MSAQPVSIREVEEVLAGARSYDDASPGTQARAVRASARRSVRSLAACFSAAASASSTSDCSRSSPSASVSVRTPGPQR